MGACYSVTLKVNVLDLDGATKALQKHIIDDKRTRYSLDECANHGVTTETFDDLIRILLAETQQTVYIGKEGEFTVYDNAFNASYGWECVMIDWFNVLAPYLADGSQMLIYPDSDYDELIIKNGVCVQVH